MLQAAEPNGAACIFVVGSRGGRVNIRVDLAEAWVRVKIKRRAPHPAKAKQDESKPQPYGCWSSIPLPAQCSKLVAVKEARCGNMLRCKVFLATFLGP